MYTSVVALTPPAAEYEPTVYEGPPLVFWILFSSLIILSIYFLVITVVFDQENHTNIATILILWAYAGFFLIPLSRGYHLYASFGSDIWTHLGIIFDVLDTGYLSDDRYPGANLVLTELSLVMNVPPQVTRMVLPFIFFALLVISARVLSRALSANQKMAACATLAATPLVFSSSAVSYLPWLLALSLLLLLLWTSHQYITTERAGWFVLATLFTVGMTWYHPISLAFGLVAVIAHSASYWHVFSSPTAGHKAKRSLPILSVGITSLVSWNVLAGRTAEKISGMFVSMIATEPGGSSTTDSDANYTLTQVVSYFVLPDVGLGLLYCIIAAIFSLYILLKYVSNRESVSMFEMTIFVQCCLGAVISILFFVVLIHGTGPLRVAQYLILFGIFATAILMHKILNQVCSCGQRRNLAVSIAVILVCTVVLFGAATAYEDEWHVTEAAVDGYSWNLDHKEPTDPIYADLSDDRFAKYHYGYSDAMELRAQNVEIQSRNNDLPNRLGYQQHQHIGESIDHGYIILREADITTHLVEPDWRLDQIDYVDPSDHDRLHDDESALKVYDNGDVNIWTINSRNY
jgi:hypothetical protein